MQNSEIDHLDKKILSILMEDGKIPYSEIGKKLYVSSSTIHVRVKRLEQLGVLKGSSIIIDYNKLGYDVTAFIGIYLDKSSLYEAVVDKLKLIPEVVEANYTTGLYSVFAKLICRDTNHLRQVLHHKIQHLDGIQRTETFISLEQRINRPASILDGEDE